ncbi:MAG: TetR/AcrR family transcriptional regulator [Aquabacterium sp.]|nr:TetR/AcrR family transcriptional regulator [Aquabacterium sp.]
MRRRLVEIAEDLLVAEGPQGVTAEEVARRADVSLQTVYNRIGGKQALLLAIAERAMEENRRYIDLAYDVQGTVEERGRAVFLAYVKFAFERPQPFRILANPPEEPAAMARIAAMAAEQNARQAAIIREGIAEGSVNPSLDPEATAHAIWSMLNGLLLLALRDDGLRPASITPESLVQTAMTMMEFGLRRRQCESPRNF